MIATEIQKVQQIGVNWQQITATVAAIVTVIAILGTPVFRALRRTFDWKEKVDRNISQLTNNDVKLTESVEKLTDLVRKLNRRRKESRR